MKGDFSRITFDPSKHYRGVLHQQGRVWLDSDWNEDVFERLAILRQEMRDVIGPNGFPTANDFQLSASIDADADNFLISSGRAYVDGNLAQVESNFRYLKQPDFPDAPRLPIPTDASTLTALVYLDVWHRLITYLEDDSIREVALGGPDTSVRLKTITQVKVVTVPNTVTTCQQASQFLPTTIGGGLLTTLQPATNPTQTVCQLPDPANFTGRENHLYRVQVHDAGDVAGLPGSVAFTVPLSASVAAAATTLTLNRKLSAAEIATAQRNGFITVADSTGASERVALTNIATTAANTTLTLGQPLAAAYTTANAAAVTGGVARFKWSRDNAAFAVGVTTVKADRVTVTLSSLGRDLASTLRQGDQVELTDDTSELGPNRGHLTFLKTDPDPDLFTVVLNDPLPASFVLSGDRSQRHLVLRRWDGVGDAAAAFTDAGTPGMNLGEGVHVQFGGFDLHPGDYWTFTARSADGSIAALSNAEANGVRHSYCPLGLVTWGPPPATSPASTPPTGFFTIVQDCRRVFPSLINFPQAAKGFHVNSVLAVDPSNVQSVLPNDTNVQINSFAGIDVAFDAAPDPASIVRPTAFLVAEYPASPGAYFPLTLNGTLAIAGTTVSWRALPATLTFLNDMIVLAQSDPHKGVLVRLVLKGSSIWTANDPNTFLDGTVFGQASGSSIALRLPSGDGRRGNDFCMWFWLVAAPSFPKDITVNPSQIFKGGAATITVTFTSPALSGSDPAVVVTSGNPAVAAAPPIPVPVPTNATSVSFSVLGLAVGTTSFTAKFNGQTLAASLDVVPPPAITGQVTVSPSIIFVNGAATGSITLTVAAPAGGSTVALTSSAPNRASVPGSVVVPAGSATASFTISGGSQGSATITATLNGSVTGAITVRIRKGKENVKDNQKDKEGRPDKLFETKLGDRKNTDIIKPVDLMSPLSGTAAVMPSLSEGTARSFIRPEERPSVEDHVVTASGLTGEEIV